MRPQPQADHDPATNCAVLSAHPGAATGLTVDGKVERLVLREDCVLSPRSVGLVLLAEVGLRDLQGPLASGRAHDLGSGGRAGSLRVHEQRGARGRGGGAGGGAANPSPRRLNRRSDQATLPLVTASLTATLVVQRAGDGRRVRGGPYSRAHARGNEGRQGQRSAAGSSAEAHPAPRGASRAASHGWGAHHRRACRAVRCRAIHGLPRYRSFTQQTDARLAAGLRAARWG